MISVPLFKLTTNTLLALTLLLHTGLAQANSLVPALPMISVIGWLALPLIVLVEAAYHHHRRIPRPFRLAFVSNLFSSLVGLLPAALGIPLMAGPAIEGGSGLMVVGMFLSVLCVLFHGWVSSVTEHYYASKAKYWRDMTLPRAHFYRTNAISYTPIGLLLLVPGIRMLTGI